ncbi:hypothetical protein P7C71_g6285, partial [Lecanoromycetidae sp. Uapishka_2]
MILERTGTRKTLLEHLGRVEVYHELFINAVGKCAKRKDGPTLRDKFREEWLKQLDNLIATLNTKKPTVEKPREDPVDTEEDEHVLLTQVVGLENEDEEYDMVDDF